MKKSDLKTGMLVVLDNGQEFIVYKDTVHGYMQTECDVLVSPSELQTWRGMTRYSECLQHTCDQSYNIIKVYKLHHPYSFMGCYHGDYLNKDRILLWERKKESAQDKKIQELEETVKKAQEQIEQLKQIKGE